MNGFVAVTPYGRRGASARVRVLDWLDRLAPDVPVHTYAGTSNNSPATLAAHPLAVLGAHSRLYRLTRCKTERLLLHRAASPFGYGALEARLIAAADSAVYDFDDALQWEPSYRGLKRGFGSPMQKCIRSIQACDRVVAGNDVLAEWAGQFARDVVVVPSCVDPTKYPLKQSYELSDPPRLVWIGSASSEKYLSSLETALLEVHRRWGARLTVVGQPFGRLGSLDVMTDRVAWNEGSAEHLLSSFDIGLGPLRDDAYSRGKCAYKLLQYGAVGLPFVASPVGANATVGNALGGRLASDGSDWIDQIGTLLDTSLQRRKELGKSARKTIEECYSFQAWEDRWAEAVGLSTVGPRGGNSRR